MRKILRRRMIKRLIHPPKDRRRGRHVSQRETHWEHWREHVWPSMGYRAFWRYVLLRFLRLADDPHRVALGFSFGAWVSFTPWLGFHLPIAWLFCWIFRGGYLAALMGTWVGNPWTYALLWWGSLVAGRKLMGVPVEADGFDIEGLTLAQIWNEFGDLFGDVLLPMTVGGLVLGGMFAAACYLLVFKLVKNYRAARVRRTMERKMAVELMRQERRQRG